MSLKIFIGSSTETQSTMLEIAGWIESAGHMPLQWTNSGLFLPGTTTFDSLHQIARKVDAAVFIFGEDDKVWYRGEEAGAPRDNVLFEYGLLSGALGHKSVTFALVGNPRMPADLWGVTALVMQKPAGAEQQLHGWLDQITPRVKTAAPAAPANRVLVAGAPDPGANPAEANVRAALLQAIENDYDVHPEPLDVGQTSYVYRAEDHALKRTVAIKVLNPYVNAGPPKLLRDRFVKEMEVVADLKHRNVIGVYAGRENGEYPFVVLEYVNGVRLDRVIRSTGVQPLRKVCKFVSEIAQALSYAHQRGFIRHKLCPSNILIDKEGHPVISPFRLMRNMQGLIGSGYISPEALKYQSPEEIEFPVRADVTEAADQYSLGLIAYEMLSGTELIPQKSLPQILAAKQSFISSPVDIKKVRPNCPDALCDVVARMLSVRAEDRFLRLEQIPKILDGLDLDGTLDKRSRECKLMHEAMDSFARCRESKGFFENFYSGLFERSPLIKAHFPDSKFDLETQYYLLREALDLMLQFPTERGVEDRYQSLYRVAESHLKRSIQPELYEVATQYLLEMVARHDPRCKGPDGTSDPHLIEAWTVTIQPAIDYMSKSARQQASSAGS